MTMTNNFDNENVKCMASYADWDIEEIKTELPKQFPNAESIIITYIKPEMLYATVDGTDYAITPTGECSLDI